MKLTYHCDIARLRLFGEDATTSLSRRHGGLDGLCDTGRDQSVFAVL